jgi:sortase A
MNSIRLSRVWLPLILAVGLTACSFGSPARRTPVVGLLQRTGSAPISSTQHVDTPTPTSGLEATLAALTPFWLPPTQTPTPSSLPDYPIPSPTAQPSVGPDGGEPDASPILRIVIPTMGLDTVVKFVPFDGDTWLIGGLRQEVAWMGDTSWPGLGGNTGLAGHVDLADGSSGPFWNLKDLKSGDEVILYTESKVYTYHVRQQEVVDETDLSVVEPTDNAQVTLITCTGWDSLLRSYLQRLIVFADLVNIKPQ